MSKLVYISAPIDVDMYVLNEVISVINETFENAGHTVDIQYWGKNLETHYDKEYWHKIIADADYFVIIHPKNLYNFTLSTLGAGSMSETIHRMTHCFPNNPNIWLGYQRQSDEIVNVYQTRTSFNSSIPRQSTIQGIGGSAISKMEIPASKETEKSASVTLKNNDHSVDSNSIILKRR